MAYSQCFHFKNWKFPSKKSKNSFKFPSQNFDAAMLIQQPLMEENLYFTMNIKKLYSKRTNILIKLAYGYNEP